MNILVAIPAYNEEKTIRRIIGSVPKNIGGHGSVAVLVVDDGSNDQTGSFAAEAGARVIRHKTNYGLGRTFQEIAEEALLVRADILVSIDGDGQFDAEDIPKIVQPIIDGQADCVTASRFVDQRLIPVMPRMKRWGNKKVARLISFVTGQQMHDVSCGFRAYSQEALFRLNLFGKFTYTHETLLNLLFKDMRVLEVPIKVRGEREFGKSKVANNLWHYGYNIFNTIFRTMLDYKPLKFFGWGGVIIFAVGLCLDLFIFIRLLAIGQIFPFTSIGFGGLALNLLGLLLMIVGLLADMINRVRMTQERVLYFEKKHFYQK